MTRETLAAARQAAGDDTTLTDTFNDTSGQDHGSFSQRGGHAAGSTGADGAIAIGRRDDSGESATERLEGGERPLGDL